MKLRCQELLAGDIIVGGLILTIMLGSGLPPPGFDAFGYGMDHALGFGLGIYLAALPDAFALMWIVARTCRNNNGTAIRWPAFAGASIWFVGLATLVQYRLYPLMHLDWLMVVFLARLFAFSGVGLLWAIPLQLWANKNAQDTLSSTSPP